MTIRGRLAAQALRLAAGAATACLVLAGPLAGPAVAEDLTVDIDAPVEGSTLTTSSTVTVAGTVTPGLLMNVDRIIVEIISADGATAGQATVCTQCEGTPVQFSRNFTLAKNGAYQARVTASGSFLLSGITVTGSNVRAFSVGVAPAAPTEVTATRLGDDKVRVSWKAVPTYPDFMGYIVYRARPGGDFEAPFGGVRETSLVDDSAVQIGGRMHYVVAAVRPGAAPGVENWLLSRSSVVVLDLPATSTPTLPPSGPGTDTTGTTSSIGVPAGPAFTGSSSADLGAFFNSASSDVTLPSPSPSPLPSLELPDPGFTSILPFPGDLGPKLDGRYPGRPSVASGTGEVEDGSADGLPDSNRRALLVPVAAGSVLCVAALHLRWLSRRLVVSSAGVGFGTGDLEHAELDLELDGGDVGAGRETVGAGAGPGGSYPSH